MIFKDFLNVADKLFSKKVPKVMLLQINCAPRDGYKVYYASKIFQVTTVRPPKKCTRSDKEKQVYFAQQFFLTIVNTEQAKTLFNHNQLKQAKTKHKKYDLQRNKL